MFNENYKQEYERAVFEAREITKELHEFFDRIEHHEDEAFRYYKQDPHFHVFERQREVLERLRHASEHYFGQH